MRVVQVNCVIDDAGRDPAALLAAWPTLPAVAVATARAGAEVIVVQASKFAAVHRQDGVTYRFVAVPRWQWRKGSRAGWRPARIARAVADAAPDVVHFHGLDFPFHARAVCRIGVPVLVQDHASRATGVAGRLRRWGYRNAAGVVFTAATQADPFLRKRQLRPDIPVFAIPESSSDFTPGDQDEARSVAGVFGDPAMLWVGHLDRNKDPLTILAAVRRALDVLPDLHLWCAYENSALLPDIERLLHADPLLAAHVHLFGRVPHDGIETLCRACDFILSGSRRESTGYTLIEAIACGTTPIVTDIAAFRALTRDAAIGALVPVGDAGAFAASIVALAGRPRAPQRRAAVAHFRRHLSFDIVGAQLVDAWRALIARSGRP